MCRQTFRITWYIKEKKLISFIKETIKWKHYKREEFWDDNLYRYWNRLIGCRNGHKRAEHLSEDDSCDGKATMFCFACQKKWEIE